MTNPSSNCIAAMPMRYSYSKSSVIGSQPGPGSSRAVSPRKKLEDQKEGMAVSDGTGGPLS